jgi:pyruvate, water dikinase
VRNAGIVTQVAPARHRPSQRWQPARYAALLGVVATCASACGGAAEPRDAAQPSDREAGVTGPIDAIPGTDVPLAERPDFLTRLASTADYALMQGEGGEIKYLGQVDGTTPPVPGLAHACMFQNTERYLGHITFLRSFPELASIDFDTYLAMVMKRASRVLWGGELKFYPAALHPTTGVPGILVYFIYSDPNDVDALTEDEIVAVDARLKACVPFASDLLVLVGMDDDQAARFETQRPGLQARGVRLLNPRQVQRGLVAEGYSLGEGYGYLKVVPAGKTATDYGPRDVVVTEIAPSDLALVAGLVTSTPQNLHSHVNLRLQEKQVPSAYVSDIYQNTVVGMLDGRLVHLVVSATKVQIDPTTLAAAQQFWASRRPGTPSLQADLSVTSPRDYTTLRAGDAVAFGTKASNLGELHALLPAANRVEGFGVPFASYQQFMTATGLDAAVEALLADPRTDDQATFRDAQLASLADRIEGAKVPADLFARLQAAAQATFGDGYATIPLRFRSSSNAEDGELLSGAGIYDSARGCFADDLDSDSTGPSACLSAVDRQGLEAQLAARRAELAAHPERTWLADVIDDLQSDLTKERTVARALKKVYASLWSRRAFEERAYWGIDHRAVFMGVAVDPAFVLERLDAVAVTNLAAPASPADGGVDDGTDAGAVAPLYRVVSQVGGESVVRPADPSAVAETMVFARNPDGSAGSPTWFIHSSLSPDPLWSPAQLAQLAALLFQVHDHFSVAVYPNRNHPSLDVELKLTSDARIVVKQVRPYLESSYSSNL